MKTTAESSSAIERRDSAPNKVARLNFEYAPKISRKAVKMISKPQTPARMRARSRAGSAWGLGVSRGCASPETRVSTCLPGAPADGQLADGLLIEILGVKGDVGTEGRRDGETEVREDGGTERRGDGGMEGRKDGEAGILSLSLSLCLSLSPSLRLSVALSPCPSASCDAHRMRFNADSTIGLRLGFDSPIWARGD